MKNNITKETNLVKLIRFGIYLVAFVPLVIFNDFISPFHFGKVVVFRSLIEVIAVFYLVLFLKDRSYLPKRDKIFWAFFLFTSAFTLTTITSVLPYPSFWGSLERMGGLWTFWHYFLFYIILTSVLTKKEHWRMILDITIFVGVLSAFYGFGQKTDIKFFIGSGGRARIFGTIGNTALFAGTQLLVAFLCLTSYFVSQHTNIKRTFYLFSFVITSIAVFMTAVRGSLLGYAIGLLVFAFLWGIYKKSKFGRLVFSYMVGLLIIFIIFSLLFKNTDFIKKSRYLSRVTDISLKSPTTETRFWAWEAGIKGWVDSPKTIILGWGPENFNIPFSKYFNPKFFIAPGSETLFDRAHNMFVEMLVTMGLAGLLAYIGIFIAAFSSLRKLLKNRDFVIYGVGFMAATVAYIIHNSFIFDTSANFIIFFTILGFISYLKLSSENEHPIAPVAIRKNGGVYNILGAVFLIVALFLIYKTNILPAKANYATTRAIIRGWESDFEGAIKKYEEAVTYDVPGKYEYRHRFAQYLVGPGGPSVKEEMVREIYKHALVGVEKNIKENPVDYLPYLYASRINILLGKDDPKSSYNDEALRHSLKALELSPTFIRTYYEIAQAYLNKKDYPKAIEYFQKAADLNPDAGISYAYLGAAKIENGDLSGTDDLERAVNNKNPYRPRDVDFQRLINAYLKTNDFKHIAWIYEQMILSSPNDPQLYASLATAYANIGRINDAVAVARKAVEIDPSFEPDARLFLKSLGREL